MIKATIKGILLPITFLFSLSVAAEIVDNETELEGSFLDTASGRVWMDLDVTVDDFADDIINGFVEGGKYYGWRFATSEEVAELFYNLVNGEYAEVAVNWGDDGPGGYYATNQYVESPWDDAFDAMVQKETIEESEYGGLLAFAFYMNGQQDGVDMLGVVSITDLRSHDLSAISFSDRQTLPVTTYFRAENIDRANDSDASDISMMLTRDEIIDIPAEPTEPTEPADTTNADGTTGTTNSDGSGSQAESDGEMDSSSGGSSSLMLLAFFALAWVRRATKIK